MKNGNRIIFIALLNDQLFRALCVFFAILFGAIILLPIVVSIINAQGYIQVFVFFFIQLKMYILPIIVGLTVIMRAFYLFVCYLYSTEGSALVLKILSNNEWADLNETEIKKSHEVLIEMEKETDKRIGKYVRKHRNVAGIEFEYCANEKAYKRRQYFWLLSPEKLLNSLSNNYVKIRVSKISKNIAFLVFERNRTTGST